MFQGDTVEAERKGTGIALRGLLSTDTRQRMAAKAEGLEVKP